MRKKLDENLGRRAAAILETAGHDVSTVADQRLAGAPDESVIRAARDSSRCLLTLDLDFANPLLFHPPDYLGIAVMRLPPKPVAPTFSKLSELLPAALNGSRSEGSCGSCSQAS